MRRRAPNRRLGWNRFDKRGILACYRHHDSTLVPCGCVAARATPPPIGDAGSYTITLHEGEGTFLVEILADAHGAKFLIGHRRIYEAAMRTILQAATHGTRQVWVTVGGEK